MEKIETTPNPRNCRLPIVLEFTSTYLDEDGGPVKASDYRDLYTLEENVKIGKNRVDIKKLSSVKSVFFVGTKPRK